MVNDDITYTYPEVRAAMPVWKRIRDICKRTNAVEVIGNEYPLFLDPSDKSTRDKKCNTDYIQHAISYTIIGNTKVDLLGLAFRKDLTMTTPNKLNYPRSNADGAGASIHQQSQQVTEDILEVMCEELYTDCATETDEVIIPRYQTGSIVNWHTKYINRRDQLVLVVLRGCMEKEDNLVYESEIQYRELALENGRFVYRVWRESTDAGSFSVTFEYHPKSRDEDSWDEIPFTFVGTQNDDPTIDESPLAALIEINLGYCRNSTDYEDSVFFYDQVQPMTLGLDITWRDWPQDKGIRVGSRSPFLLSKEGGLIHTQAQPNTLAREAMDSRRDYSAQLDARSTEQNGAVKTVAQSSGEQAISASVLGVCVSNVSEAYMLTLGWCVRYLGIKDEEYRYNINQGFIAKVVESGMVTAVVNAWQYGAIRDTDMVRILRRPDLTDSADDSETVIDAIHNDTPNLISGNNGNGE